MFCVDLQNDPENDRMISDHILRMHRYRSPGEQDGEGMNTLASLDNLRSLNNTNLTVTAIIVM